MNEGHILEFRQRVASFDKEEVKVACDILAATHPADYLNALVRNYKRLLESHEAAGAVFKQFVEENDILIGKKIPEENFEETVEVSWDGMKQEVSDSRDYRDVGDLYDPVINDKEFIPKKMAG